MTRIVASVIALALIAAQISSASAAQGSPAPPRPSVAWHVAGGGATVPAVADGTVYFLGDDHCLIAVEQATGHVRWRVSTGGRGDATAGSDVVVVGPRVVVGDYDLVAFDRATGRLAWRFVPVDGYGPGLFLGDPAGDLVMAGSPSGRLYAVDAADGTERWSVALVNGAATVYRPVVSGRLVAALYTEFSAPIRGGLALVDVVTGRVRWKTEFDTVGPESGSGFAGGPVFRGDVIIAGNVDGRLSAFAVATGRRQWTLPPLDESRLADGNPGRDFRALAWSGSLLVAGSLSGTVVAYDLSSRRERWRYHGGDRGSTQLRIAADGRFVVVPYLSGELVGLDAATGAERWQERNDAYALPPALAGDWALASGANGFYGLKLPRVPS